MNTQGTMATGDYVSVCKHSAVVLGYWQDRYISMFVEQPKRKSTEIHRMFYNRVKSIDFLIQKFVNRVGKCGQIVNLGAGLDSLFWRLKDQNIQLAKFIEIDFPPITAKKCHMIDNNQQLLEMVRDQDEEIKIGVTDLHAGVYHLVAADLTNLEELEMKLNQTGINFSLPTLFIAESVLMYIENELSDKMMRWIASRFISVVFVNYDICNMADTVGKSIFDSFRALGCDLKCLAYCETVKAQMTRFLHNNWHGSKAWEMFNIYDCLPSTEKQRIENIETLDQHQLLVALEQHYCICIGWIGEEYADIDFTHNSPKIL